MCDVKIDADLSEDVSTVKLHANINYDLSKISAPKSAFSAQNVEN